MVGLHTGRGAWRWGQLNNPHTEAGLCLGLGTEEDGELTGVKAAVGVVA